MKPAYAYLTDDDREYVIATKKHLAQLMQRHGVSVDDLSFETGIPTTSIRRWLNVRHSGFMPLPAARRICDYLGIEISDLLLPIGRQRHLDRSLRIFLRLPPRLADTVIDQLMVMADALAPPSSSGHPAVTTRATRHNCKKSCAHNVHYVQRGFAGGVGQRLAVNGPKLTTKGLCHRGISHPKNVAVLLYFEGRFHYLALPLFKAPEPRFTQSHPLPMPCHGFSF